MPGLRQQRTSTRTPARHRKRTRRSLLMSIGFYLGILLFGLWILLPVWFLVLSSFTTLDQLSERPFSLIPDRITFENYYSVLTGSTGTEAFGSTDVGARLVPAIGHSLLVSSMLVCLNLLIAGWAAYGLSRYPFTGAKAFELSVIASRVVPAIAIIGPFFVAFRIFDMLDTSWALLVSYNIFTLPIAILVLKNYFDQLPREIEEAAKIDGASRMLTLWIIVVPIAKPGLVAAGVLIFLEAWGEFFYALVLTNQLTVPPLLAGFQSVQQFNWNTLAAATVMSMLPPIVLVFIFQRYVVNALTAGVGK